MPVIDKALNASLIAFNNKIVSLKNVVKRVKVNEAAKLIRKIKNFTKKKGTESQLEKNKRKCENLKKEITHIKKLKFNDVAIFAFENDDTKFEDYIKNNKNLSGEQVALARVGLNKILVESLNKIKIDPQIDGWKRTFIQYKSRCEKRRNWREKTKLLKEIESNLQLDSKDEENENDEDGEDEEKDESDKPEETEKAEETEKESETKPKSNLTKSAATTTAAAVVKSNKKKEENSKIRKTFTKLKEEDLNEENFRKVKFSDDESSNDDDDDEEEDDNDDDKEDEKESDISEQEEEEDSEIKSNSNNNEIKLKPLVIEKKPARMVIKQINLNEIKDFSEIPIESKNILNSSDEDDDEDKDDEEDDDDDDDESQSTNKNKADLGKKSDASVNDKHNEDEETYKVATIKLEEDPFFLDKEGNEIQSSYTNENGSFRSFRDRYSYNRENYSEPSGGDTFNKRNFSSSSFQSSLSSRNTSFRDGRQNNRNDWSSSSSSSAPYKRFNDSNQRQTSFGRNNDNRSNYENSNRNEYNNDSNKKFKGSSNFDSRRNERQPGQQAVEPAKTNLDVSKLHPSWQAKKLLEEKLKSIKFEGKKVKFDDDD